MSTRTEMSGAAASTAGRAAASNEPQLLLAEIFGPTFQGEGPSTGRVACFVRFGGCNLTCGRALPDDVAGFRCDTGFTWDWERYDQHAELTTQPLRYVTTFLHERLDRLDDPLVVITGGEPLMRRHRDGLVALADHCEDEGWTVEIETNGTLVPDPALRAPIFNVSPKLANTGDDLHRRLAPKALGAFTDLAVTGRARFKFVVSEPRDLDEVALLVTAFDIPGRAVWIMPEGVRGEQLRERAALLADLVLERGWNLTGRMHVALWQGARSR